MPARRVLPDNEVLVALRGQGWSYDEIAATYGSSKNAVYLRLRQAGATKTRPDHGDYLPRPMATEHHSSFPAQALRWLSRMNAGEELDAVHVRMVRKWLRDMEETGSILCYERDYPPNDASPVTGGFHYKRRKPEDGNAIRRKSSEELAKEEEDASKGRGRGRK